MTLELRTPGSTASEGLVPIHVTTAAGFAADTASCPPPVRQWLAAQGFSGAPDSHALVPDGEGRLGSVWAGVRAAAHPFALSALPRQLPPGRYALRPAAAGGSGIEVDAEAAAMSWALGGYRFERYKAAPRRPSTLVLEAGPAARRGQRIADAITLVRDLVNTPAEDMGPDHLAAAAKALAKAHGAKFREVVGEALLKQRFPAIHAVGRAAAKAPRLIELDWGGDASRPLVVLVGKGVCFDSGGLDIKSADGMRLMKKDMGGAANALGLASLVMGLALPIRLKVLIPAVENMIAGNAMRPGDVFRTRKGLSIEIGNTDAEGRVILCDALAYGAEAQPALLIDLATLTGAARVALGAQLPALFCRDTAMARELVDLALERHDPMWHLPLWRDYHAGIEGDIADIVNTGRGSFAGAINAALFLEDFVPATLPWLHLDLYAWNDAPRPGRPGGGEAMTIRALLAWLERRFGAGG
jgi:leucyl aminopeptidase